MNETLYKQKLKNLKDTLIVKDGVFSDKYLFFHELISTSAFIESSILDLYKSKMNSKMPTSVVEALKKMKEKESTLWNVREIFKKFYLSFKKNVDVKQLQDKITGGKIGIKYEALRSARNQYAHTGDTKIDTAMLIDGLKEIKNILKIVDDNTI